MLPDEDALRAAARELIAAGRSFLDAAEAMIDDPAATERLRTMVTIVAQQAQRIVVDDAPDADRRGSDPDQSP